MREESPVLSIVVPVYNGAEFIYETLQSLVALSRVLDCEVICQNALSTDGTGEIIDAFCDNRKHWYHYNESDSGQSEAINRGISRARGRWVTWLCADDIIIPDLCHAIQEADRIGAHVVYGDVVFAMGQGVTPAIGTEICRSGSLSKSRLIIQQPGTCILRKSWEAVGGVNLRLNWSMDYDLFMRLESNNALFHRSKRFVAVARIHKEAKTSSGSIKRLFEIWSIILRSHFRQPAYFRLRPYMVYLLEYIIKNIEARDIKTREMTRLLGRLHTIFWVLAMPKEQQDIEERFNRSRQDLSPYIAMAGGA